MRQRQEVQASKKIMGWGISSFMNTGADYEIFDYLEHTSSPDPANPALLDRLRFFVEGPREQYLTEFITDLTGKSGRDWQQADFALRPPRKKARDEWEDDHVSANKIRRWALCGWVRSRQVPPRGLWIVWADGRERQRLRKLRAASKRSKAGR